MSTDAGAVAAQFDREALRAKYRQERDKRLRAEGNSQYVGVTGQFAHYLDDPYIALVGRAALHDTVEVLVIGGGFAALLIGARLREAGIEDIRFVEKGGDFGGTWYWNRYPGAACDTEAYIYLPLLEETGYVPTEKYAKAPEILAHSKRIAEHYDLYRNALFQTQITELRWDETSSCWRVRTDRGDHFSARFVCMANGPLNRPKLPGVPGIEQFKGHSFHTSRWDYAYTGGDSHGNLTKLRDKRVGVIGTGATGVQCIPHLGANVGHLYVFQRTPSSIDVRANRPTDPNWVASLEPGWQRRRMENFSTLTGGGYAEEDLVMDGWTEIIGKLLRGRAAGAGPADESIVESLERVDFEKMEQIRARAAALVNDPNTAEALKPFYRQFCKRPCFHDEYLQTFNRPNVTLIDTDGQGIERITERGILVGGNAPGGTEYPLDCIIYASGFEVGTPLEQRAGYEVYGCGGVALSAKWKEGVSTLFGMQSNGFPNCFIVGLSQVGVSANIPHVLDVQSHHIGYILKHVFDHQVRRFDVSVEAEAAWVQKVMDASVASLGFLEACTPGYYNNEGKPNGELIRRNGTYAPGIMAFAQVLDEWRADERLSGIDFS